MTHLQACRFRQALSKALRLVRKNRAPVCFAVYGFIFLKVDLLDFTRR
jgi:hypothetical protein